MSIGFTIMDTLEGSQGTTEVPRSYFGNCCLIYSGVGSNMSHKDGTEAQGVDARSHSWGSKPGRPEKGKTLTLVSVALALSPESRGRGWTQTNGDRQDEPAERGAGSVVEGGGLGGARRDQLVTKWSR